LSLEGKGIKTERRKKLGTDGHPRRGKGGLKNVGPGGDKLACQFKRKVLRMHQVEKGKGKKKGKEGKEENTRAGQAGHRRPYATKYHLFWREIKPSRYESSSSLSPAGKEWTDGTGQKGRKQGKLCPASSPGIKRERGLRSLPRNLYLGSTGGAEMIVACDEKRRGVEEGKRREIKQIGGTREPDQGGKEKGPKGEEGTFRKTDTLAVKGED